MTAPIRSMPELIDALRMRRDELNISHETIDSIAGLQSGYTSKLLAPKPIKNLGPMSFGSLLGALGLAVVVVPDVQAVARVQKHWVKRKRPQRLVPASIPASIDNQVPAELQITPELKALVANAAFMKTIASLGGIGRSKRLSPRHRRIIAKRAARARWSKHREAMAP